MIRTVTLRCVLLCVLTLGGAQSAAAAQAGLQTFMDNCSACHQATGKGIPGAFPALAGNKFVQGDPKLVVTTLLNGRGGMPTFRDELNDAQIASVLSYVRSAWGNTAKPVTPDFVTKTRAALQAAQRQRGLQSH
jgi:cytochrome c6